MTKYAERMVRVETKVEAIEGMQAEIHVDVKDILASMHEAIGLAKGEKKALRNKVLATGGLSGLTFAGIFEAVERWFY